VNRIFATLIGLGLASPIYAQDFMQQWRDGAIVAMNAFRAGHLDQIKAQGWQFVGGAESSEGIPNSDVFVKDVKVVDGPMRSAYVLNVSYVPIQASGLPEYQATKALILFNCAERSYEYRSVERYMNVEVSGNPNSSDTRKAGAASSLELKGAELLSMEKNLFEIVCSAKT
jgi:hypothetical protein